jgi:hypothetical protein
MAALSGYGQFNERGVTNMAILSYLRKKLTRQGSKKPVEYVREDPTREGSMEFDSQSPFEPRQVETEIDLSQQADLEGYAQGLSVSKESIERWISSGLLMPDEMKVAEKIVKIMNKRHAAPNDHPKKH